MTEVILNDECMHCNNRECHNGEHFCNQAMKDNSFYKNARLYKGLEIIHRTTYEELEQENAILKGRTEGFEKQILGLLYKYESVYKRFPDLKDAMNEAERILKENAELKKEIAEEYTTLQERIAELEKDKQYFSDSLDKQIEATLKLQQENAELDCQKNRNKFCYSCVNATEKCFKNEIGCPCNKYKSYKEELKKWKDEWQEQVQKATDEGYARTLQTMQLTKAKEHIRTLISCLIDWVQEGDKDYCHIAEAEQFLKDSEVAK